MIQEAIKIQCPDCKCVLNVKNPSVFIEKNLICPKCKANRPFKEYPRVVTKSKAEPEVTQYAHISTSSKQSTETEKTQYSPQDADITTLPNKNKCSIGKLKCHGLLYSLKPGVNIVGRKAATSKATVQIDVQGLPSEIGRTMSRHHLQIIVQSDKNQIKHLVKLLDNVPNETYLNKTLLHKNDIMILSDGDVLKMGKVMVEFVAENVDSESTIY